MSEHVELTNPVDLSVGGMGGHVFRRAIHIGMACRPVCLFRMGREPWPMRSTRTTQQAVSLVILDRPCRSREFGLK